MSGWRNRIVGEGEEPPDQLLAHPLNWRVHPKNQQAALEGVLDEVGWVQRVLVNKRTGTVVDGHLRVALALRRAEPTVPVLYVDLDEREEALILVTMDPIAAMAGADAEKLAELLRGVSTDNESVSAMLDDLAQNAGIRQDVGDADAEPQVDRAAELAAEWGTALGQVWALGDHRLACGDCTDAVVVARVMGGAKPNLMVTDPPYGVEYDANWRNEAAEAGKLQYAASRVRPVQNDDRTDWSEAYLLFPGAVAYTWSPGGDHVIQTGQAMLASGFDIRAMLVWSKPHIPISRGHYAYQHEPVWYGVRRGANASWIGPKMASSVWEIALDHNVDGGHSTQKPVECMARPIRNHEGDVYDPFVGSGTTIIAAEQLGRRCYAVEIDPGYVAVCLQRYLDATGKRPELIDG